MMGSVDRNNGGDTVTLLNQIVPEEREEDEYERSRENEIQPNSASNRVNHHSGHHHDAWSLVFFFLGSVFYVVQGIWDLLNNIRDSQQEEEEDYELIPSMAINITSPTSAPNNDDDDWGESIIETVFWKWDAYDFVSFLGPFMYLLNALNDLRPVYSSSYITQGSETTTSPRNHQVVLAVIFGTAAVFDLMETLIYDTHTETSAYISSSLAVHFYMIYAIVAMWDKDKRDSLGPSASLWLDCCYKRLVVVAELLFFVGSLIDVITSYFVYPGAQPNWRHVYIWYLVSAVLWFLCAIFDIQVYVMERMMETSLAPLRIRDNDDDSSDEETEYEGGQHQQQHYDENDKLD